MRKFNESEKLILKKLISIDISRCNLGDFITDNLSDNYFIEYNQIEKKLIFGFCQSNSNIELSKFIEMISLLIYLEENNSIFIHSLPFKLGGNFLSKNITFEDDNYIYKDTKEIIEIHSIERIQIITSLYDYFERFVNSFVYINNSLIDYVEHDFLTPEERNFIKQLEDSDKKHKEAMKNSKTTLNWTRAAFIVALIPSLVSIYSIFSNSNYHKLEITNLDSTIKKVEITNFNTLNDKLLNAEKNKSMQDTLKKEKQKFGKKRQK